MPGARSRSAVSTPKGQSCNDVPVARWGNSGGVGCADHTGHEVGRVSPLLILFGDFCPILRAKWQKSARPIGAQGFEVWT